MASSRETNTMAEGLRKMLQEITKMKTEPDADLEFLINLETEIIDYLHNPPDQQSQTASAPPPDMMGAGGGMDPAMMGAMGGGAPPMPVAPPGTPAAGGITQPAISPDELRRMLGQ